MLIQRDLTLTPLYQEIEKFYSTLLSPGRDKVTDATDLSVAPDGRSASFTAIICDSLKVPTATRIGTVELETGEITLLAHAGSADCLSRWSPSGGTLAFVSDRGTKGTFHICLTEDRGVTVRAMRVEGVVESLQWSPDGKHLLACVAGLGADLAGAQGGMAGQGRSTGEADRAPTIDIGDADNLWRRAFVLDVAKWRLSRVGPDRLNVWEACWIGNDRIAAVVSDFHSEGSWYSSWVVELALASGEARTLFRPRDQVGVPAASSTGEWLALIDALCSDRLIVCGTLVLVDVRTLQIRKIDTHGADVTHIAWRNDTSLVYAAIRGLDTVFGEVDLRTGAAQEWLSTFERTCGGWYPSVAPLPQGGALVVGESFSVPPEFARVGHGRYDVVCSLGTEASLSASFSSAQVEPCTWKARDGLEIQGILIRPDGVGPWPLVLDLHGGPVHVARNRWMGRLRGTKTLLDHGIAVLYPNIRGSTGRGDAFVRLVKGDMGGEDTHDCLRGIDALVERGITDPQRLGVTGISYGGFMAAWLITQDKRFAAAVPISPVTNWYSQHRTSQIPRFDTLFLDGAASAPDGLFFRRSPVMHTKGVRTPVLLMAGALDRNTPSTQALEFHRSLLAEGATSVLVTYPAAGHGIRAIPEVIDATTRYVGWFVEHLLRPPA